MKISRLSFFLICGFFVLFHNSVSHSQTLFQENFEDTNFSARSWYDNTNLVLSATEHIAGSTHSAEFFFAKGATNPTSGGAIRKKFTETESVYVSYYVKFSANWTGSNKPYHPHEFYLLTNLDSDWSNLANTHMTTYIEQNEGVPQLAIQDSRNIDESNIGVDLTNITEARAVAGCNGDSDGYGNGECYLSGTTHRNGKKWQASMIYFKDVPGPYYKNDWHHVEAYFKLNSISGGQGVSDGQIRYWYDGNLIIDINNAMLRTGQNPTMKFKQFAIAPYIGDGSPIDQTFWIDNLTVGTVSPTTAPPHIPSQFRRVP